MKRSEMIKIIDQCTYDYTDDDFMIEKPSEFVYELLSRIEKAGMLPPVEFGAHIDIEMQYADEVTEEYCKWDLEDE